MDKHSSTMDEVNYHLCMHKLSGRQLSGYDMPRNVDPSVKKGVSLKQLAYCML